MPTDIEDNVSLTKVHFLESVAILIQFLLDVMATVRIRCILKEKRLIVDEASKYVGHHSLAVGGVSEIGLQRALKGTD